jgi:peptidoglycan/LPS O-acetylase OafA/YrhL
MSHRADIDGLRGLAVGAVILFHLSSSLVPGGFTGVDVFFVISGFLITRNISAQLAAQQFSFPEFYSRRVKRLSPAFISCLAFILLVAVWLLLPAQIRSISEGVLGCVAFSANFYFTFFVQAGYFAESSALNPLLHLWSLAVEEQFYFVWPALFVLLSPHKKATRCKLVTLAALVLSLQVSDSLLGFISGRQLSIAYYMLPSRVFELLIGAYTAQISVFPYRALREVLGASGLLMMLFGMWFLDDRSPFPGFRALIPCLGASLFILGGTSTTSGSSTSSEPAEKREAADGQAPMTLASLLLTFPPLVLLGEASYSAYLFHWPVMAFARLQGINLSRALPGLSALLFTGVLTYFNFRFVEKPLRAVQWSPLKGILLLFLLPSAVIVLAALALPRLPDPASAPPAVILVDSAGANGSAHAGVPFTWNVTDFEWNKLNGQPVCSEQTPHICIEVCGLVADWAPCPCVRDVEQCRFGDASFQSPALLLVGDSHAAQASAFVEEWSRSLGFSFFSWTSPGCAALFYQPNVTGQQPLCPAYLAGVPDVIEQVDAPMVLLGGQWSGYRGWNADIARYLEVTIDGILSRQNRSVILMGELPELPNFPGACPVLQPDAADTRYSLCVENTTLEWQEKRPFEMNGVLRALASKYPDKVHYWDPRDYICSAPAGNASDAPPPSSAKICSPYYRGVRLYSEHKHLTYGGARLLGYDRVAKEGVPAVIKDAMIKAMGRMQRRR